MNRRHISVAQRALIAAQLATLKKGVNQHTKEGGLSRKEAATLLSVSEDSIDRASKVIDSKSEALIKLAKSGAISISDAAKVATSHPNPASLDENAVKEIVDLGLERLKRQIYKTEVLDQKRTKAQQLAENNDAALLTLKGKYSVIYADPPWDYGGSTKDSFCDPSVHYPLMPLQAIKALDVKNCLTKDAALFLWVPNSMIPQGVEVLNAWGFEFVTTMVWCKDNQITSGSVTRAAHETLLVGKKGDSFHLLKNTVKSWHHEAITVHSRKPEYFAQMIDAIYPGFPKLEMFARTPRSKEWSVFGNQVVDPAEVAEFKAPGKQIVVNNSVLVEAEVCSPSSIALLIKPASASASANDPSIKRSA